MKKPMTRRRLLGASAGLAASLAVPAWSSEVTIGLRRHRIPSSGASVPVIGLGSWLTFDAGSVPHRRDNVRAVMQAFFDQGGGMIDSSPMYSSAQEVIGAGLAKIENTQSLFSASKVWIPGRSTGIWQMESALKLWGLDYFNLLYVHNLLDWNTHLPWLREWQQQGRVRHVGVTTSHGRRHGELLEVMRTEKMDCVQFTYNIVDREAERRLLPVAREQGLAVVINRPFRGGSLFNRVRNQALPDWAADIDVHNWAQYFLKFIVSHPAVTCAIPATSQVAHLRENMGALSGPLPDSHMRQEMIRYYESI